jgi:hypothetical protein
MGEWKAQISLRVRQQLRHELEDFAAKERRTPGNLGELLVEWSFEQLRAAGSTEKLLNRKVPISRNPDGNYRRGPREIPR